jgi:hypothetical protein
LIPKLIGVTDRYRHGDLISLTSSFRKVNRLKRRMQKRRKRKVENGEVRRVKRRKWKVEK